MAWFEASCGTVMLRVEDVGLCSESRSTAWWVLIRMITIALCDAVA
jgi:hypothetical protein